MILKSIFKILYLFRRLPSPPYLKLSQLLSLKFIKIPKQLETNIWKMNPKTTQYFHAFLLFPFLFLLHHLYPVFPFDPALRDRWQRHLFCDFSWVFADLLTSSSMDGVWQIRKRQRQQQQRWQQRRRPWQS